MSQSVSRAQQLLHRGQAAEAFALLRLSADSGDAQAAALLGELRIAGHDIRRDLSEARMWFGRAADLGLAEAEPIFVALLANGAGGSERRWEDALARLKQSAARDPWAARQSCLISAMQLTGEGDPQALPAREALCNDLRIETLRGFLTLDECRYLIDRAEAFLEPSTVVDPRNGRLIRNPMRSASAAGFPFVREDPALHAINRRIAAATSTTYEQGEPLQVLRYRLGEDYKLHSDALPPGAEQRVLTLLVALGADFGGGETSFPRLGLTWRGQAGDALIFTNLDNLGQPDERAWHAGLPVIRGTKHLLSKWIRLHPLDLSGPAGRPL